MTPFNLTTDDGESIHAWHVLPLPVYGEHEARLLQASVRTLLRRNRFASCETIPQQSSSFTVRTHTAVLPRPGRSRHADNDSRRTVHGVCT